MSKGMGDCVGFSGADLGSDLDDRKSIYSGVFQISGRAVSWSGLLYSIAFASASQEAQCDSLLS